MPKDKHTANIRKDTANSGRENSAGSCVVDTAVGLLPLALWLLCTLLLFPAERIWAVIIGGIGTLPLGFVLRMVTLRASPGEAPTFLVFDGIPLVSGSVVVIAAAVALYLVPDGNVMTHYCVGLIFHLINIIFSFPKFRFAVEEKLRRARVSKSRIKKLKQGAKNYWFLTALHRECDIGIAYPLNAAFVVLFPAALTMQLLLGWCRLLLLPVGIVAALSLALGTVLQIVSMRRTIHGSWREWLGSLSIMLMTAASAWVEMSLTLDVLAGKTVYK